MSPLWGASVAEGMWSQNRREQPVLNEPALRASEHRLELENTAQGLSILCESAGTPADPGWIWNPTAPPTITPTVATWSEPPLSVAWILHQPPASSFASHRLFSTQQPDLLKPRSDRMTSQLQILQRFNISFRIKARVLAVAMRPTRVPFLPPPTTTLPIIHYVLGHWLPFQSPNHTTGPLHLLFFSFCYTLLQNFPMVHFLSL